MSWETTVTHVLSADTTDALSADTTDVLTADTTDVLSTDTSNSGKPTTWFCQIWHPQKWKSVTIWTYREISQRKSQEWHSLGEAEAGVVVPGLGDTTFPWEARVGGVPVPKNIGPFFKGAAGEGVWDLQKMRPDPGFRKDFPHYWALPVQCREGWGPLV